MEGKVMSTQYPQPKFIMGQKIYVLEWLDLGNEYCEHCKKFLIMHRHKWITKELVIKTIKIEQDTGNYFSIYYQGYSVLEWYNEINTYLTKEEAEKIAASLN